MTPAGRSLPSRRVWSSASSRAAGSRVKLSSTSTKTGVAPRSATASAVAAKVKAGRNTASPGRAPKASSASVSASVPLAQPSAKRAPERRARASSSVLICAPPMYAPSPRTSPTAARIPGESAELTRNPWKSPSSPPPAPGNRRDFLLRRIICHPSDRGGGAWHGHFAALLQDMKQKEKR